MVVSTDPGSSSEHRHHCNDHREDTPSEHSGRRVVLITVLEGSHHSVDEPGDTGGGTARVDTSEMLQETGQEDTNREGCPLRISD